MSENTARSIGKKGKALLTVAVIILALSLCGVFISRYAETLVTEGTVEIEAKKVQLLQPQDTPDAALSLLSQLIEETRDTSRVSVDLSTELSVDDESISMNGSDSERKVLSYMKNKILDSAMQYYPAHEGRFGDGFTDTPKLTITSARLESGCCTTTESEGEQQGDTQMCFEFKLGNVGYPVARGSEVYSTFKMDEAQSVLSSLEKDVASVLSITKRKIACAGFSIDATANAATGRLESVTFARTYNVALTVKFVGALESAGEREISFTYSACETYSYKWAGVFFTADTLELYEGGEDILPVVAVTQSDATEQDYTVSFESSDENTVSVDGDGNVTGLAVSEKPCIITVTFVYLGNTYKDTCEVYVAVPVRKIIVSPRNMTLAAGSNAQLTYVLEPADATRTGVLWFTENESIAVIDESGVVTAVSEGQTKVYAVSVDGHFRSSCFVTVTKGQGE